MTEVDEGSLFGDMDVANISDDPFEVAPNTYWCICTESFVKVKEGDDGEDITNLVVKWQIDDPESEYHHNTLTEWYRLFPGKKLEDLDPEEKKKMKFLKRRLRRGFDLSEEEMQKLRPSQLIGEGAFVTVVVKEGTGANAGKSFTNVQDAMSKRLYEEENGPDSAGANLAASYGI